MKKLFIATRILFFLSFFLPFLLLPQCGPSATEKLAKENAKQDSIRMCDSAYKINHSNQNAVLPMRKDAQKPSIPEKHFSDRLSDIHSFLKFPTENSISGYGIAILSIEFKHGGFSFLFFIIMLAFIASIAGILLLLIKHHHIIPLIISLCSVIFLITFLCILLFDNTPLELFLWGYWTSLALSLTNVVLAIILRKKRLKRQA
jgi:hypothetical protein